MNILKTILGLLPAAIETIVALVRSKKEAKPVADPPVLEMDKIRSESNRKAAEKF